MCYQTHALPADSVFQSLPRRCQFRRIKHCDQLIYGCVRISDVAWLNIFRQDRTRFAHCPVDTFLIRHGRYPLASHSAINRSSWIEFRGQNIKSFLHLLPASAEQELAAVGDGSTSAALYHQFFTKMFASMEGEKAALHCVREESTWLDGLVRCTPKAVP